MIIDNRGDNLTITSQPTSEAERFWQYKNLSKGTTDFVSKDGRAYLPSKVTDCQNGLIPPLIHLKIHQQLNKMMITLITFNQSDYNICLGNRLTQISHTTCRSFAVLVNTIYIHY